MTREEIITGLKFTVVNCLLDPDKLETITEPISFADKITIDACKGAIDLLEQEPFINKPCISQGVCNEDKIKVLDKIKAEIKDWQTDIHDNEYNAEKHDFVFERIYEIIDEYRTESEE